LYKIIKNCKKCDLYLTRKNAVPGTGNGNEAVMFVGEAPGMQEDLKGIPFVGNAGNFLMQLLSEINLERTDVYITNVVKCRPPGNRVPTKSEINVCSKYLEKQIAIINPSVICLLGNVAITRFLNIKISDAHGKVFKLDGRFFIPMYHPAAVLYKRTLKKVMQQDMYKLKKLIEQLGL
jgi:DNA polymerase